MDNADVDKMIAILKKEMKRYRAPIVTEVSWRKDPFLVLISCILSLRTKDTTTGPAAKRLFELADNPRDMLKLTKKQKRSVLRLFV